MTSKENIDFEKRKKYLPIGSVVLLQKGDKKLMIFGIMQCNEDDEAEEYDYIGVPYPEGNMGDDYQYLFYHEDIAQVFFRGYEDEERSDFIGRLDEYVKDRNQNLQVGVKNGKKKDRKSRRKFWVF